MELSAFAMRLWRGCVRNLLQTIFTPKSASRPSTGIRKNGIDGEWVSRWCGLEIASRIQLRRGSGDDEKQAMTLLQVDVST
jgi:hypothetical protein